MTYRPCFSVNHLRTLSTRETQLGQLVCTQFSFYWPRTTQNPYYLRKMRWGFVCMCGGTVRLFYHMDVHG